MPVTLCADVVLLIDVPNVVKHVITQAQEIINTELHKKQGNYLFEKNSYETHITLNYISSNPLSLKEIENNHKQFLADLKNITDTVAPFEINSQGSFDLFLGKKESEYQGVLYKNYAILIITLSAYKELVPTIEKLDKAFAYHAFVEPRQFPFNPHVTIGYLYHKNDESQKIEKQAKKINLLLQQKLGALLAVEHHRVNAFILSAHDGKQKVFPLKKNN